jgi:hypothetical protein
MRTGRFYSMSLLRCTVPCVVCCGVLGLGVLWVGAGNCNGALGVGLFEVGEVGPLPYIGCIQVGRDFSDAKGQPSAVGDYPSSAGPA